MSATAQPEPDEGSTPGDPDTAPAGSSPSETGTSRSGTSETGTSGSGTSRSGTSGSGTSTGAAALVALRRARQRRRLGELDWFEVAYRVYLMGGFGGGAVLWISASIHDSTAAADTVTRIAAGAPGWLGLVVAVSLLLGLRGGSHGGPVSLEAADVTHVMLAPVARRLVLRRPAVQRLRSALFASSLTGAVVGQLAGRRLPGSLLAWAAAGALFGAVVACLWIGSALLTHALRVPRAAATSMGLVVVIAQSVAVWRGVTGPTSAAGSLGLWGWRQNGADALWIAAAVGVAATGLGLLERLSLEALARRSALVAQLKFAVTMQDLRTVVLLRRQLNQEQLRSRPWFRLGPVRRRTLGGALWRRGWQGLLRYPLTRLLRMAALAAAMGLLEALAVRGTTPAVVGTAVLGFVLGMEAMEPLSQEVDQADRADALPFDRGELLYRHLAAGFAMLVPFAVVGGVVAVVVLGLDALAPVAILAVPVTLGAALGGVVSIVRDAPDPAASAATFVPPEVAGFTTTLRLLWPIVVSSLPTALALLPRSAAALGQSVVAAAVRAAVGIVLLVLLTAQWVRLRDRVRRSVRAFMADGRAHTAEQKRVRTEGSAT